MCSHATDDWHEDDEGARELLIPAPAVFSYLSHYLLWDSGTGRRLCDIPWTIVVLEMMVFTIMVVFGAAYYEALKCFLGPDPRLYPSAVDMHGGGPGRLFVSLRRNWDV